MSTGRVQNPEGAKTIILSYKTAAGAVAAIKRQNLKIICFTDTHTGRRRVDNPTIVGGKQDPSMQGKRMVLIYRTSMHTLRLIPEPITMHAKDGPQCKAEVAHRHPATHTHRAVSADKRSADTL